MSWQTPLVSCHHIVNLLMMRAFGMYSRWRGASCTTKCNGSIQSKAVGGNGMLMKRLL